MEPRNSSFLSLATDNTKLNILPKFSISSRISNVPLTQPLSFVVFINALIFEYILHKEQTSTFLSNLLTNSFGIMPCSKKQLWSSIPERYNYWIQVC